MRHFVFLNMYVWPLNSPGLRKWDNLVWYRLIFQQFGETLLTLPPEQSITDGVSLIELIKRNK